MKGTCGFVLDSLRAPPLPPRTFVLHLIRVNRGAKVFAASRGSRRAIGKAIFLLYGNSAGKK